MTAGGADTERCDCGQGAIRIQRMVPESGQAVLPVSISVSLGTPMDIFIYVYILVAKKNVFTIFLSFLFTPPEAQVKKKR